MRPDVLRGLQQHGGKRYMLHVPSNAEVKNFPRRVRWVSNSIEMYRSRIGVWGPVPHSIHPG